MCIQVIAIHTLAVILASCNCFSSPREPFPQRIQEHAIECTRMHTYVCAILTVYICDINAHVRMHTYVCAILTGYISDINAHHVSYPHLDSCCQVLHYSVEYHNSNPQNRLIILESTRTQATILCCLWHGNFSGVGGDSISFPVTLGDNIVVPLHYVATTCEQTSMSMYNTICSRIKQSIVRLQDALATFCMQLKMTYVTETSCNQLLLID